MGPGSVGHRRRGRAPRPAARDREQLQRFRASEARELARAAPETAVGTLDRIVDILNAVEAGARTYTDITRAHGPVEAHRPPAHPGARAARLPASGRRRRVRARPAAVEPRLVGDAGAAAARPGAPGARATGEGRPGRARSSTCVTATSGCASTPWSPTASCARSSWSAPPCRSDEGLGRQGVPRVGHRRGRSAARAGRRCPRRKPIRLARMVATTARRGWADSIGEREAGVASVSAPVLDAVGGIVAAVSVSGPANRIGALRGRRLRHRRHRRCARDRGRARRSAELSGSRKLGRTCLASRLCNARSTDGSPAAGRSPHRSRPSAPSRSIAATPRSPFHPVLPESAGQRARRLCSPTCCSSTELPHGVLIVIGFVAMIAAGVAFLLVLWAAERGEVSTRTVVTLARRLPRRRAAAAAAALARRLQLRLLRSHPEPLRAEPVRQHAGRLPGERHLAVRVGRVARHPVGLRPGVRVARRGDHRGVPRAWST